MRSKAFRRGLLVFMIAAICFSLIPQFTPHPVFSQGLTPQKVESDDALVTQAGAWSSQGASGASGGGYLYNTGDGTLQFEFYGSSIEVLYVSGPGLGTLAVEVDGTVLRTVITTADATAYQKSTKIAYLTDEWHTLRVYAQDGGVVGVDAFVALLEAPPAPTVSATPEAAPEGDAAGADDEGGIMAAPTNIVINEADMGDLDSVELYNPTGGVINIGGYILQTYGFNDALEVNFNIPSYNLFPGHYVIFREGSGSNTANTIFMNQNIGNWVHGAAGGGAVILYNATPTAIDFVRWGTATLAAPVATSFTGTPSTPEFPNTLGRNASSDENNSSGDWSSQCATLGGINQRCLVINEVFYGDPDQVELYNASSQAISLTNYDLLVYDTPSALQITFTFPAYTLQPGAYVTLVEGSGTNTATTLYMTSFTTFVNTGGAVLLRDTGDGTVDFIRWGTSSVTVPADTGFAGETMPVPAVSQGSIARWSNSLDANRTSDWCGQLNTLGRANNACVVINEVDQGDPDSIEIYNASTANYPLTNWNILFINDTGATVISYVVPSFTLNAGSYVRILEGAGTNTATTLFTTTSITEWFTGEGGSAQVFNSYGTGIDFVRWGNVTNQPGFASGFSGVNPPALTDDFLYSLGRSPRGFDRDLGSDWCQQPKSILARNVGCASTLVTFNTTVAPDYIAEYNTLSDPPGSADYRTMPLTAPVEGQWVMGDWDGDGVKTPGLYGTNGVFYHTNLNTPNPSWDGTWFGLTGGFVGVFAVAGRFNSAVQNDCLGVIDSTNYPGLGAAFALYYTCDTVNLSPALSLQWLSVLLPDSQGFSGAFEFDAGNYNPATDAVDSIACRRGPFIAFTNTPPTTFASAFDLAQYIGNPPGSSGTLYFAVGDWNSDGVDSFGIYSASQGFFWYRNDLDWNSGSYGFQNVGLPVGVATQVATWSNH